MKGQACNLQASRWADRVLLWTVVVPIMSVSLLLVGVAPLMAQAPQGPYQSGAGHADIRGIDVPFVPGPIDNNGKVYQVEPPANMVSHPRGMTKEGMEAKRLAEAGQVEPTTKPGTRLLTPGEVDLLHGTGSNVKPLQPGMPNSSNASAAISAEAVTSAPKAAGFPGANFPGAGPGIYAPDGGVAAGPYNVVAVVNSSINVYDKNGNLLSSQYLWAFFSAGGPVVTDFVFDPSVVYDANINRFWVLATSHHDATPADNHNRSTLHIAVSNGSDVTSGGWRVFALDAMLDQTTATNNWCDFPQFGIDAQAIYFSCNMYSFPTNTGTFQYAKVRVMTKSQFTANSCCSWWDFWDFRDYNHFSSSSLTVRPAIMHFSAPADGDFWVVAEGVGGGGHTLDIWHLTNAQNCCFPTQTGPTLNVSPQDVGPYNVAPGAKQPGTTETIDTGDTALLFATWQSGHLSTGHTIACLRVFSPFFKGTIDSCAAFEEVDVSGFPNLTTINDWALNAPAGVDVYYPFVEQNSNGDKTMVYSRSDGSSTYAGAYYTTIPRSSICTYCTGGETLMHAGGGPYVNKDGAGRNRWGDYMGAGADPDGIGIWVEGEYATNVNTWGTEIVPTYASYIPSARLTINPIAFGGQPVSSISYIDEKLVNEGNATLYAGNAGMVVNPDFSITYVGCLSQTLQPGASCVVTLKFSPQSVGPKSATLNVTYSSDKMTWVPLSVNVTGTGGWPTSTSVTSSVNPSVFGQAVIFTATVTPNNAIGTVTFQEGAVVLGSSPVASGKATLSTASLQGGVHSITATYNYNSTTNLLASTSPALTQTVNPAASRTTITSSKNPSVFGQAVTFTATVMPVALGSATPTGLVTLKGPWPGTIPSPAAPLINGKATFRNILLPRGSYLITAVYTGSTNYLGSTSLPLAQIVN